MNAFVERLLHLDRRIIFLLVAAAVVIPILRPLGFVGVHESPQVKAVYDKIDSMKPGSILFLSCDFDPSSKPELLPMAQAILHHAFSRDVKVIGTGLWNTGVGMMEPLFAGIAADHKKLKGADWVYLGWASPGNYTIIIGLGQDLVKNFPKDYYGTPTKDIPLIQRVPALRKEYVDYVISISAGDPGIETWLLYGAQRYGYDLGGGCTAVTAPGLYPYFNSGQLKGILGGQEGAAKYEALLLKAKILKTGGLATAAMDSQSVAHVLIFLLIVASNVLYFMSRRVAP